MAGKIMVCLLLITLGLERIKGLKCKNLLIITEDKEEEKEVNWFGIKRKIKSIPLWKWLLQN